MDFWLAHGDETFGFAAGREAVGAGWFTPHDRIVGVPAGQAVFDDFNAWLE